MSMKTYFIKYSYDSDSASVREHKNDIVSVDISNYNFAYDVHRLVCGGT